MVLSTKALEGIAEYQYKPGSMTWLDTKFTYFWNGVVEYLPLWLAPNVITLFGTFMIVSSSILLFLHSPTMTEEIPAYISVLLAICLFIYQTCDAIDGKQARRTGTSSPVGQLLDHGGDAICNVFTNLAVGLSVGTGPTYELLLVMSIASIVFFMAQWEEYHTGILRCGNGSVGVTEGLVALMALHIFTAILGSDFWNTLIYNIISIRECALGLASATMLLQGKDNIKAVCEVIEEEKSISKCNKITALTQLLPSLLVLTTSLVWMMLDDISAYPYTFFLGIGISHVALSSRMIISHMCKVEYKSQLDILFGLSTVLLCIVQQILPCDIVSLLYLGGICIVHGHYTTSVVVEICWYLDIHLLLLKNKSKD
ncbi:CDP-alcohol phosphatidyltransferase [Thraustotheca clavata]|uniref:CDP-alcohol phosphatidyltransferase n=1 Tax=Thraustotheca clavata TaxID=74557 RepID=A0A1V9YLB1_9STRA|nr:CDP-alcohol phosphatidyltransferase [Thraustotheca clavata]